VITNTLKIALLGTALAVATPALAQAPSATPAAAPTPAPTDAAVDAQLDAVLGSHEGYKAFLTDLQKATADEDKKAVATMVSYPFTSKIGGEEKTFENEKAFIAAYDDIFKPSILLAIKNQTYANLFVTGNGVMIGATGEVWISEIMSDDPEPKSQGIKIIAINQS
jgi:hypothetical protein